MDTKAYIHLWNKYRPAIVQMMMSSSSGPQQYKFLANELRATYPKEKGFSFNMTAYQGKAVKSAKPSALAQDLLESLKQSRKALELLDESPYEFSMDKSHILHIVKKEQVVSEVNGD